MVNGSEGAYTRTSSQARETLGLGGTPVRNTYTPHRQIAPGVSTPTYHELEPEQGAEHFHRAIGEAKQAHPAGAAVTQYPAEDYKKMRLFSTPEGDAGFALKGDDIVSVFKHPKAPYRHVTRSMLDVATGEGGKRLDAFDTVLPRFYSQSGFRAVARLPFSDEHRPEGWSYSHNAEFNGGRPDVVFMARDPQAGLYQPWDGRPITDYDEGQHHQREALANVAARGNVPAEPGPRAYGSGQLVRLGEGREPIPIWHGTPHQFPATRAGPLGEFDISKLGTGEGAQVYAHGPYVAGAEETAKHYRDMLAENQPTYQGKVIPPETSDDPHIKAIQQVSDLMSQSSNMWEASRAMRAVQAKARKSIARINTIWRNQPKERQEGVDHHNAIVDAVGKLDPKGFGMQQSGSLYQGELHVDPNHLLDWDRHINRQSPYVKNQIAKHYPHLLDEPDNREKLRLFLGSDYALKVPDSPDVWRARDAYDSGDPKDADDYVNSRSPDGSFRVFGYHAHTGALLHERVKRETRNEFGLPTPELAAKGLLRAGIPGVRYLDEQSRHKAAEAERLSSKILMMRASGAPQKEIEKEQAYLQQASQNITHNYVVFDPRTINIVRRNGLPAMVEAGADALRDHKRGQP